MSGVWAEMSQKGVVDVTVQRKFYPQIAQHWESTTYRAECSKMGTQFGLIRRASRKTSAEERESVGGGSQHARVSSTSQTIRSPAWT